MLRAFRRIYAVQAYFDEMGAIRWCDGYRIAIGNGHNPAGPRAGNRRSTKEQTDMKQQFLHMLPPSPSISGQFLISGARSIFWNCARRKLRSIW